MLNVVKEINDIFIFALENHASDIHVETKKESLLVRGRIEGNLVRFRRYPKEEGQLLINRLKVLGGLNLSTKGEVLDGRGTFSLNSYQSDLRFASLPGLWGENLTIRLLRKEKDILPISQLGLLPKMQTSLKNFLKKGQGLLVVGGATGSGKSTTLYSLLREIDSAQKKILTIEDPIEFQKMDITQIQVSDKISFSQALRATLRHDPDILLIGEIRDPETAAIAFNAALTGHLVLSSVHARNTEEILTRFKALAVEDFQINAALEIMLAQKLLPKKCPICKGLGCKECHQGVCGRQALFEMWDFRNKNKFSFAQTLKVMLNKEKRLRGEFFDADINTYALNNS